MIDRQKHYDVGLFECTSTGVNTYLIGGTKKGEKVLLDFNAMFTAIKHSPPSIESNILFVRNHEITKKDKIVQSRAYIEPYIIRKLDVMQVLAQQSIVLERFEKDLKALKDRDKKIIILLKKGDKHGLAR